MSRQLFSHSAALVSALLLCGGNPAAAQNTQPQKAQKAEAQKTEKGQPQKTQKDQVQKEKPDVLIARAKVWRPVETSRLDLRRGPTGPGSFEPGTTITCDYLDKRLSGASPKFACRLPDGDELKVKYGGTNGEVQGEVAASRLLWALGFGADAMYSVRVICRGCPERVGGMLRENGDQIIDPAAVERKLKGSELLDEWAWDALDKIDESAGGATTAERDGLKLLAVLIQHSDSKPKQQRLVCQGDVTRDGGRCATPLMMINDLGVTFGRANTFNQQPRASVNLAEWAELPIWKDATGCVGNLSGSFTGTLKNPVISERGRQFLAGLLQQLSDRQIRDMFEAARVELRPRQPESGRSGFPAVDEWVTAFKQKRAQISDRRCGSTDKTAGY
jgi:hypothetical protein